ncbi:hypothetical protein SK128_020117 [Halocaridina rubra]|uniref:C2H2-type domain-containing protein n=1 Tax=Halocaridina rubra TaxID=373956 RepID=A0AAN9AEI8_HALRR
MQGYALPAFPLYRKAITSYITVGLFGTDLWLTESDATKPTAPQSAVGLPKIRQCPNCDYKTLNASHMKTHMYIHTGEKPFSCSYCDYRCNSKTNLKTHIRCHTGEKPYGCTKCPYRTGQKSNLNVHMLVHQHK